MMAIARLSLSRRSLRLHFVWNQPRCGAFEQMTKASGARRFLIALVRSVFRVRQTALESHSEKSHP
jgi:hypothetical protein